jgi:hypothetical protein
MPSRSIVVVFLAIAAMPGAHAQSPKPPAAYTLTEMNATMGPSVTMKIDRDGPRVVVESTNATTHSRFYYDFEKHKTYSMNLNSPSANCSPGDFSGDWGDPFGMLDGLMKEIGSLHPHQTSAETVNGFEAKVMEAGAPGPDHVKYWVDTKSGLMVKLQGGPQVMLEVKRLTLAKPPASVFAMPAACGAAAPTKADHIAEVTSGYAVNFADALRTPPSGAKSCTVLLRVLRAVSTEPITTGFRISTDANPGQTSSGGGLHDVTGQLRNGVLRIDNAPAQFQIEASFGGHGNASATLYRSCFAPQTVLLLLVKNPTNISDGTDWLWVKSGRFAVKN